MFVRLPRSSVLALLLTCLNGLTACGGTTSDAADVTMAEDTGPGVPIDAAAYSAKTEFLSAYAPVLAASQTMTLDQFLAAHTPADLPVPLTMSYDPLQAKYMDVIQAKLALTAAEQAKLAANGFVVADRLQHETMPASLLDIFHKDLPVLVTTDAIFQALHASYDDILKTLELHVLSATIQDVLTKAHTALAGVDPGVDPQAVLAKQDADMYLTVARSLLAGQTVASLTGGAVDAEVGELLADVAAEQMKDLTIFGAFRTLDFSQFKPRGHYAGTPELERYFRTLMWLGRTDLRFAEPKGDGTWMWRPRQTMVAMLLRQAVVAGNAEAGLQSADDLISLMVGPVDYINLSGVQHLTADQKWQQASDIAALTPAQIQTAIAAMVSGQYGAQQIASQVVETDPFSDKPTPLPPAFALLGQRFVVDSYVFSNVTYDRIIHDGAKVERVLPNPLDALFVLGNDQVLPLLSADFAKFPYWGALHDLRWLVDQYNDAFWQGNVYNLWLDALRQMNAPTTAAKFPRAMRTPAWRDKTAHTQLASWAQLRHDTLLYAKQSYTGGVACAHPGAYVEPYPQVYARLGTLAAVANQALQNAQFSEPYIKTQLNTFFTNWQTIMGKLQSAAEHELAGVGLTQGEADFLKSVISQGNVCGQTYSGWYTTLFFQAESLDKWRPTIADVHTNPNAGPLPGPDVLHVGTGYVSQLVLTVDTCTGAEAFVGPVFRYHEVDVHEIRRMDDAEWEAQLKAGTAPAQPAWTLSYRVPQ